MREQWDVHKMEWNSTRANLGTLFQWVRELEYHRPVQAHVLILGVLALSVGNGRYFCRLISL